MIKPHPAYTKPSQTSIDQMLDYCGYTYHLPKEIFEDLISIFSYWLVDDEIPQSPNPVLQELYSSLCLETFRAKSPLEGAVKLLMVLQQSYDLRKLEKGITIKNENGKANFISELDEVEEQVLENDEVQEFDSAELAELVKFSSKIDYKLLITNEYNSKSTYSRMKDFKDVVKTKKSTLVRPDFEFKLVNKNIKVKNNITEPKETDEIIIYLEDASKSMSKKNNYSLCKAIQILLTKSDKPVHYYRYVGNHFDFYELITKEDKLEAFTQPKVFKQGDCNYKNLVDHLNKKYKQGVAIISTDGEEVEIPLIKTHLTIHAVTRQYCLFLNRMIKSTGGKYIIL